MQPTERRVPERAHTLVFQGDDLEALRTELLRDAPFESAAFLLARAVRSPRGGWRLLVYEVLRVEPDEYSHRTSLRIDLPPEVIARVAARARAERASVVLVHTHPGGARGGASPRDRAGEQAVVPALARRAPWSPHARLILGPKNLHAALFPPADSNAPENGRLSSAVLDGIAAGDLTKRPAPLRVVEVGSNVRMHDTPIDREPEVSDGVGVEIHQRQVLAFGAQGQQRLTALRVAIVGVGGTGSVVAQQLAHLGVGELRFIDPDSLEVTNRNRVVGGTPARVSWKKVRVAQAMVRAINPDVRVVARVADVRDADVLRELLDVDFFFCCTDSHGSRAVLSQFAYQYLVPGIDLGVAIIAEGGLVSHITGRVQMLAPGLACLACSSVLDPELVRRDLLTDTARANDPYVTGGQVAQPAVISINSTASSLAVTMFLAAMVGIPVAARNQRLRLERGVVTHVEVTPAPGCPWCSAAGALARGDSWSPPGRPRLSSIAPMVPARAEARHVAREHGR